MINVQNLLDLFLTDKIIEDMGNWYPRVVAVMSCVLPTMYIAFSMACVFTLFWALWKLVSGVLLKMIVYFIPKYREWLINSKGKRYRISWSNNLYILEEFELPCNDLKYIAKFNTLEDALQILF